MWKNIQLLPETNPSNAWVKIDLKQQRGMLMNGDEVVMDYPICSGIKSRPTPPGDYKVLEKIVDKSSNMYGKIYDVEGNMINGDADANKDTIPEGGKFVGAPMRYWMRLTWDGVGHHIGLDRPPRTLLRTLAVLRRMRLVLSNGGDGDGLMAGGYAGEFPSGVGPPLSKKESVRPFAGDGRFESSLQALAMSFWRALVPWLQKSEGGRSCKIAKILSCNCAPKAHDNPAKSCGGGGR